MNIEMKLEMLLHLRVNVITFTVNNFITFTGNFYYIYGEYYIYR